MRILLISATIALSGCSLVYDFGSFDGDGVADAGLPDVNPANLALARVLGGGLTEGTGCLPPGEKETTPCAAESAPVPVVIEGENILASASVTLDGMGLSDQPVDAQVSVDGRLVAFELAVPVDVELPEGEVGTLAVTVSQPGADPQSIDVEVAGLDELVASSFDDAESAVAELSQNRLYSVIEIDRQLDLVGAAPFHLRATSRIAITEPLSARGRGASAPDHQTRRAGGCPGGNAASDGGCGQSGGGAGPEGDGGGGGGNQDAGSSGGGGNGNGGPPTPSPFLVPLAEHTGQGGGGAAGVVGGDGGGLIALTCGGRVEIGAAIDVGGGAGENTDGVACNLLGGPGGGGGAGGSVLIRARTGVTFSGAGSLTLASGPGGPGSDANCDGGNGSVGRLRVDTPSLSDNLADVVVEGDVRPTIGAIIGGQSTVRTGPAGQSIELSGDTANRPVTWISVNDTVEEFSFEPQRTVELIAGLNEVCVHVTDPSLGEPEESRDCVDIAYLP